MASKIIPCGFCGGSGKVPSGYGGLGKTECPVCLGRGRITIAADAKRCAGCNGTGKHYTNYVQISYERHFTCHGTGWVARPPVKATPPH